MFSLNGGEGGDMCPLISTICGCIGVFMILIHVQAREALVDSGDTSP
jgi:hypothetical protein